MDSQSQIKRVLSATESLEYIQELLENNHGLSRSDVADLVCEEFEFYDARGKRQRSGCLKALRELEAAGHFVLPDARAKTGPNSPRRLFKRVPKPTNVPAQVGDVLGLRLVIVHSEDEMRVWNEMMFREHPQKATALVGPQIRYLVDSEHGLLGGLGFAAAALKLADRERWIGWDEECRRANLQRVVGMSRFLIRPNVECKNLASRVLSMAVSALPDDFEHRYNYRPWLLESFVDTSQYSGACYRAANWILIGETKGRGRQDRLNESGLSTKAIYVYPLESDFRKRMGLNSDAGLGALSPSDGILSEEWAQNEFGGAPLGDARLEKRLVSVATAQAESPGRSFSGVAQGDWPAVKAYYRMIDSPDETGVNMPNILAPHRQRTIRRMQGQRTVLCIQDGSDLNYNNLDQCEGLGEIGTNQTGAKSRGLHLHTTLTVASNGLPLGVLRSDCIAAEGRSSDDERSAAQIPIEEKKSFIWIQHHRNQVEVAAQMPGTRLVDVCDREADIFELFEEQRKNPRVELLVRAKHNRNIMGDESTKLFESVREMPVESRVSVIVPRQSARPKKSKQKKRPKRPERTAELAVRYKHVRLRPPVYHAEKEPINVWIIHAREENPPAGTEAVEWFLLTTIKIETPQDAQQCLRWYCLRWRIEDWHRVIKSGCRIEDMAHKTAERLRRAIAIKLVIGWRIMLMTLLSRETPELPADVLFSDIELKALTAYSKKKQMKSPVLLGDAVRMTAKIGGYLGRNSDSPPGHQLLWQGLERLHFMCEGFALHQRE